MDLIEAYVLFFLISNVINQIRFGYLSTHIIFSEALEIPILGRVFMLWRKVFIRPSLTYPSGGYIKTSIVRKRAQKSTFSLFL